MPYSAGTPVRSGFAGTIKEITKPPEIQAALLTHNLFAYFVAQAMQGSKARTTRPTARASSLLMPSGLT